MAHRLSTVESCDQIIELVDGRVAAVGTFVELVRLSPSFRQMVEAEHHDGGPA